MHKDPDYSCVYVVLRTDDAAVPAGYGLTFTLGRGNEVVAACVRSLDYHLIGADFDADIVADMTDAVDHRGFYYRLCQDGQMRWLGPEKGVVALACGAIMNAVWDIMARRANKPVWLLVAEMEPERLVELIDFKHIADFVSKDEALALLQRVRPGWEQRVERMKTVGFRACAWARRARAREGGGRARGACSHAAAHVVVVSLARASRADTTSCGWLGYPEHVVRAKCRESLAQGHTFFKMKVGSRDVADDVARAQWIRDEIGPDKHLMMDANQKWNVDEAVRNMQTLAAFRPMWIEEPTNCDDVVGHATIAKALRAVGGGACGVATGEACANKVLFKQLLQLEAIRYCQIDSCRVAGVNEILGVLLMAAKARVKVCPHAGGVGLCEYVRHLCMIDFVCFNPTDEPDRVCEMVTECSGYFHERCEFNQRDDGLYYRAAEQPGYAQFTDATVRAFGTRTGLRAGDARGARRRPRSRADRVLAEAGERRSARARARRRAGGAGGG